MIMMFSLFFVWVSGLVTTLVEGPHTWWSH